MTRRLEGPSARSVIAPLRSLLPGLVFFSVASVIAPEPATAGGIGASFSFGGSESRLSDEDDVWQDIDTDNGFVGLGLIFDTNLAQDRLFNYRLNTSLEFVDQDVRQAGLSNEVQGTQLSLDQTFGFGFLRTPDLRVYLGPSLHLGIGGFDDDINVGGFRADYEAVTFTAGVGPELGVNFHVGEHLTFSTSAFVRYGLRLQRFDDFYDEAGSDGVFTGDELRAGIVTSIFFRFGRDAGY